MCISRLVCWRLQAIPSWETIHFLLSRTVQLVTLSLRPWVSHLLIAELSDYNDYNGYNDYNDFKDYNDYNYYNVLVVISIQTWVEARVALASLIKFDLMKTLTKMKPLTSCWRQQFSAKTLLIVKIRRLAITFLIPTWDFLIILKWVTSPTQGKCDPALSRSSLSLAKPHSLAQWWTWRPKVHKCNLRQSMKKTQIDIIGGFLGEISQMDGERFLFGKCYNLFWGGGNLSHLSGHYHFRLVVENLVKSTKNLGIAQPSPLFSGCQDFPNSFSWPFYGLTLLDSDAICLMMSLILSATTNS